jgi:hypothetical protein
MIVSFVIPFRRAPSRSSAQMPTQRRERTESGKIGGGDLDTRMLEDAWFLFLQTDLTNVYLLRFSSHVSFVRVEKGKAFRVAGKYNA